MLRQLVGKSVALTIACCIAVIAAAPAPAQAQVSGSSCPANAKAPCQTSRFCVGMNTGFFGAKNRDFPFIDLMRGAHINVDRYVPSDILRNPLIPLDANKYPTAFGVDVDVLFYSNRTTGKPYQTMPSGRYVVMWEGEAFEPDVIGSGVSATTLSGQSISFSLDTTFNTHAIFRYQNGSRSNNVRNIRIVPLRYMNAYRNWSWNLYEVGASSNPPIFHPAWLDKMSAACTIRYLNSTQTNDRNVVHFQRDSTQTRINPASSVWYEGFNLGTIAEVRHAWPWELVLESTLQTKTIPWINFRVLVYENILASDTLVQQVAAMFNQHYGGEMYVEYGNEIWNYGFPFNISTQYVERNGPGRSNDINENYALRSNLVQKTFADAYGNDGCLINGVIATQAKNPWNAGRRMMYADLEYIDVLSPAAYVGDSINPDANVWPFLELVYADLEAGISTEDEALDTIKDELLTGSRGAMIRNWEQEVGPSMRSHAAIAREYGVCLAFYESGSHMRVDKIDYLNLQHLGITDMIRRYRRSTQQRDVEKKIYDQMARIATGPMLPYSTVSSAGNGAFAYWDTVFDSRSMEIPRTQLIREFNDPRKIVRGRLAAIQRQMQKMKPTMYRSLRTRALLFNKFRDIRQAVEEQRGNFAKAYTNQFSVRIDGCGDRPQPNDYVVDCRMQKNLVVKVDALRRSLELMPARPPRR